MVRRCQICGKDYMSNPHKSFHRFPRDPGNRAIWFSLAGFNESKINRLPKNSLICSDHFDPNDISVDQLGRRIIKPGAVPIPFHEIQSPSERIEEMVRRCQACSNADNVNPDVTFHKFPSDVERRKIWCSLLGFEEYEDLPRHPYICSDHFDPKDFSVRVDGKIYIKNDADPLPTHQLFEVAMKSPSCMTEDKTLRRSDVKIQICDCITGSSSSNSQNEVKSRSLSELTMTPSTHISKLSTAEIEGIFKDPSRDSTSNPQPKTVEKLSTSKHKRNSPSCTNDETPTITVKREYDDSVLETKMQPCDFHSSISPTNRRKKTVKSKNGFSQSISTSHSVRLKPNLTPAQIEEICKVQTRDLAPSVTFTPSEVDELFKLQSRDFATKRKTPPQVITSTSNIKKKRRGYIGDMDESDFSTPEQTSKNLVIIKIKMQNQKKKIRCLQQTVRRLKYRLSSMKTLVDYLKGEPLLPESQKIATGLLTNGYDLDGAILNSMECEDEELNNREIPCNEDLPLDIKDEVDIEETLLTDHVKEEFTNVIEYAKQEFSSIESDEEFEDGKDSWLHS